MESIWTKTTTLPEYPPLKERLKTDVAVIGGGLAGILTAYLLQRQGASVIVLEADRVGGGQTGGTTAKLTAQHGLKYHQMIQNFGTDAAKQYARANLAAVEYLRRLDVDCELQECTSFLYAENATEALQKEYDACRKLGMDVFLTRDTELPFPAQALGLRHQAMFHPAKLLTALLDGLTVFEHSRVLRVEDHQLKTENGSVTADVIIFTCHYPFVNVPGYYFVRQHQERSYVLALEGARTFHNYYLGVDGQCLSFRPYGKYLLLGGGGHRTGENSQGRKYEELEQIAQHYWPQCRTALRWSAQDCTPMDGIPYIGHFSKKRPNWLVATGFQKWGMTTSIVAANTLSAIAIDHDVPVDHELFSPQRFWVSASMKQLRTDIFQTARGLGRRLLEPGRIPAEKLPVGHGNVVDLDGEKLGVYRDEAGELFAVQVKCPHLGCQLEWNPDEKSWDCPCHGSRFDIHGCLLDGPAQKDLYR